MTGRRSRRLGDGPPDAADEELVATARDVIDARTDAGPDENGVPTMGAAVRDAERRVHLGVNLFHVTGRTCAELVTTASSAARQPG